MIDYGTHDNIIKAWIDAQTGLTAVKAEQNAPQLVKPYLIFKLTTSEQVHEDYISPPDSAGDSTISGNREFTIEVQGFGPGVIDKLGTLRSSRNKPTVQEMFRDANLVLVDAEPLLNITGIEDSKFVERASVDFLFRVNSEMTDNIGDIQSVQAEGTYLNPDLSTITVDLITITSP